MKIIKSGITLLAGGLLAVSSATAGNCCDQHRQGHAKNENTLLLAQVDTKHAQHATEAEKKPKSEMDEKTDIKLQTICPVMGGKIDKNLYVDHGGKRVYICCKGCEKPLKKDPGKYIKAMEADGITVAKIQTTCPVMDGKIDKKLYVDHDGKRIYVCCQGCIDPVKKDPAKYIKAMEAKGVALYPDGKTDEKNGQKKETGAHTGHQH